MKKIVAFPVPCSCGKHDPLPTLPPRMTHQKGVRCPFVSKAYQSEVAQGTCCTFDNTPLVKALSSRSDPWLVERVQQSLSAEDAQGMYKELLWAADALLPELELEDDDPKGVDRALLLLDEVIRDSACWYGDVGDSGFGVGVEVEGED
jgi:hypothetical protein